MEKVHGVIHVKGGVAVKNVLDDLPSRVDLFPQKLAPRAAVLSIEVEEGIHGKAGFLFRSRQDRREALRQLSHEVRILCGISVGLPVVVGQSQSFLSPDRHESLSPSRPPERCGDAGGTEIDENMEHAVRSLDGRGVDQDRGVAEIPRRSETVREIGGVARAPAFAPILRKRKHGVDPAAVVVRPGPPRVGGGKQVSVVKPDEPRDAKAHRAAPPRRKGLADGLPLDRIVPRFSDLFYPHLPFPPLSVNTDAGFRPASRRFRNR